MNKKLRNETELHCAFCGVEHDKEFQHNLYELLDYRLICCQKCLYHLEPLEKKARRIKAFDMMKLWMR